MGFFERLFGAADPSAAWVRDPELRIEVDLDTASLCGVRLGSRVDGLSRLGPPSNRQPAREGLYVWNELGIDAHVKKGILVCYELGWDVAEFPERLACTALLLRGGQPVPLGAGTTAEEAVALLGEPWHRYADPDDPEAAPLLLYTTRLIECGLEFLPSGELASLTLASPPGLADPEVRRRLRVEKPWPPA